MRFALGAGRGRIIQQFRLESVLLSCNGALIGLLLALSLGLIIRQSDQAGTLDVSLYDRGSTSPRVAIWEIE